jgi:hypothetical protein
MKNFFLDLKNSFYGPSFYTLARTKSLGSAVVFLLLSALLTSFALVLVFTAIIIPTVLTVKPAEFVEQKFPAELAVTIENGKASANVEQPYILPIPDEDKLKDEKFENYLVIDTRPDITVASLEGYKSVVVLTENSLYVSGDDEAGRVIPLTDADNVKIDKPFVVELVQGLMSIFWIVVPILLIFAFPFVALFGVSYFLMVSLIGAVIPLVISKIRKVPMTYGEAYKTALYGTVPVMCITTAWLFFSIGPFPMFLDVLLFAFLLSFNLKPPAKNSPSS